MLRKLLLGTVVVLAAADLAAQTPALLPVKKAAPIRYLGTYHMATDSWTGGARVGTNVVYNCTTVGNYYSNVGNSFATNADHLWIDEGELADSNTSEVTNVSGFDFAYCSTDLDPTGNSGSVGVLFYDDHGSCATGETATCGYLLSGLPLSTTGNTACWAVGVDLAGGFECTTSTTTRFRTMTGAGKTDSHFGWAFGSNPGVAGRNNTGPILDLPCANPLSNCSLGGSLQGNENFFAWEDPTGGVNTNVNTDLTKECFDSTGLSTISLVPTTVPNCTGIQLSLTSLSPAETWADLPPYGTNVDIKAEIVKMVLEKTGTTFGTVTVRERLNKQSKGIITNVQANGGNFVSGDSFFDVYLEIEVTNPPMVMNTGNIPLHMQSFGITQIPPSGSGYTPPPTDPPLALYDKISGIHVGWLCHADHLVGPVQCSTTITTTTTVTTGGWTGCYWFGGVPWASFSMKMYSGNTGTDAFAYYGAAGTTNANTLTATDFAAGGTCTFTSTTSTGGAGVYFMASLSTSSLNVGAFGTLLVSTSFLSPTPLPMPGGTLTVTLPTALPPVVYAQAAETTGPASAGAVRELSNGLQLFN